MRSAKYVAKGMCGGVTDCGAEVAGGRERGIRDWIEGGGVVRVVWEGNDGVGRVRGRCPRAGDEVRRVEGVGRKKSAFDV